MNLPSLDGEDSRYRSGSKRQPGLLRPPRILHPLLFALFPAVSLVADHVRYISLNGTIALLAGVSLGISLAALWLLSTLKVERHKAGVLVTVFLILFFSYGHLFTLLTQAFPEVDLRHRQLLPLWLGLLAGLTLVTLRTRTDLSIATTFLNGAGSILILLSAFQIAAYQLTTRNIWDPGEEAFALSSLATSPNTQPDIYYIILDTYAHAATLADVYQFDNSSFLNSLREGGFQVAEESASNYSNTRLSLSSSLNMTYLDASDPDLGKTDLGFELPRQMIEHNRVMLFLKAQGYRIIFLGSGAGVTQANRYADEDIRCGWVDETVGRIIQSTLFWPLADRFRVTSTDDRNRRLCMFEKLAEMPDRPGPKFVFAHILAPHEPFLFDSEGNPVFYTPSNPEDNKRHYLDQLIFINRKVTALVEEILSKSAIEPLIIIQADTGPPYGYDPAVDIQNLPAEIFQQKMRILNAYHLPGAAPDLIYPDISPVNTFRLIFNHYFGTNYPLLEDQSFYSMEESPYDFLQVTDLVRFP